MKAGVEWVVAILRGGPEFKEHGDPFDFSCTIVRNGEQCELKGFTHRADRKFTLAASRAIGAALAEQGITRVTWERRKSGLEKTVSAELKPDLPMCKKEN